MEIKEKFISQFNEAAFQISRLHNDWLECKRYRENGSLDKLSWKLDSIEIELTFDAKKLDKEDGTNYVEQLKNLKKDIGDYKKGYKLSSLYQKLMEKEMLLREIQEECGKGGIYRSGDEDTMD